MKYQPITGGRYRHAVAVYPIHLSRRQKHQGSILIVIVLATVGYVPTFYIFKEHSINSHVMSIMDYGWHFIKIDDTY
ncbi:hypothetical protein D3C73_1450410 [compost metagenome]